MKLHQLAFFYMIVCTALDFKVKALAGDVHWWIGPAFGHWTNLCVTSLAAWPAQISHGKQSGSIDWMSCLLLSSDLSAICESNSNRCLATLAATELQADNRPERSLL